MVFLFFITRPMRRTTATVRFVCRYCGVDARQQVVEERLRLTLFWVLPLFTLSRSWFNRCTHCGGETALSREQARRGEEWASRA